MKILLLVLAQILNQTATPLETNWVNFDKLPKVCRKAYDPYMLKERNAQQTLVSFCDLDGDKKDEIITWDGFTGSGGEGWKIFKLKSEKYVLAGETFGILYTVANGKKNDLLVNNPMGVNKSYWSYYTIEDEKLQELFEFNVKYSRNKIKEIKIILGEEK